MHVSKGYPNCIGSNKSLCSVIFNSFQLWVYDTLSLFWEVSKPKEAKSFTANEIQLFLNKNYDK